MKEGTATFTETNTGSDRNEQPGVTEGLFTIAPSKPYKQLSPLVLAYLGDAVYEAYVRQFVIAQPNHRPHHMHRESVKYVSNRAQAKALETWMPLLTEEEADVVKRGRNAKSGTVPRNADVLDYRHSTAFECLVGYLYYQGSYARLQMLMDLALNTLSGGDTERERKKP